MKETDLTTKPIDIILITYNRFFFTKKVFKHIIKRTKHPYRLIVVDNNSTDFTRGFLLKQKRRGLIDVLLFNDKNMGLEEALNRGLGYVESDYFVTVDNDCLCPDLEPDWLSQMLELIRDNIRYAAIAMRPQVLIGVGNIFKDSGEITENNVCGGSFRIMKALTVKGVGGWTKKFEKDGRGNEEHDICGKLRSRGFSVGYATNIYCYHMFGKEGTWGYDKSSNYRMGRVLERSPLDIPFNKKTCEPEYKSNE